MDLNWFKTGLPQALLLVAPEHFNFEQHAKKLVMQTCCENQTTSNAHAAPCETCRACQMIQQSTHPDILEITPEKTGLSIKVDQIRNVQQSIYQTPQSAKKRFILIHPANELNRQAANALLKILEEPPLHAHFILMATQLETLPATIMSRTQIHYINSPDDSQRLTDLSLGEAYETDTPRGILFKARNMLIQDIADIAEKKASIAAFAAKYKEHQLTDCLWFLHLLTVSLIQYQLLQSPINRALAENKSFQRLAKKHAPVHYFKVLDMILACTKKINQDIPLNPLLTLESLLIGYT